jgi:hypothetical protein
MRPKSVTRVATSVGENGHGPYRVYDFETGRYLQRDPLPVQVQQIRSSIGNTYGIYQTTQFAPKLEAYVPYNTDSTYQLFPLYFFNYFTEFDSAQAELSNFCLPAK